MVGPEGLIILRSDFYVLFLFASLLFFFSYFSLTTLPIDDSTNRFGPILRRKRTNATNPNPSNASLISVAFFRVKNFIEQIEFTFNEQIFLLCLFYEILEKREKNLTAGTINSLLIDVLTIVDTHFDANRKGDNDKEDEKSELDQEKIELLELVGPTV